MVDVNSQTGRIYFLDYLRGLAVLLVIWGHIFLVGINDPNTVGIWIPTVKGLIFGQDSVSQNIHGKLGTYIALRTGVNSGGLGVAIFFLISGFVILKTVDSSPPLYFLIRRFFRIIPMCGVAVTGTALFTWVFCAFKGISQPNSLSSVLTSTFAMNYFNHTFSTIPVLWTLEVEMAFYLFIAITVRFFQYIEFKMIILMSLFCLGFVLLPGLPVMAKILSTNGLERLIHIGSLFVHINFMLVGSAIYRGFLDKKPKETLIAGAVVLFLYTASFIIFRVISKIHNIGVNLPAAYLALGIFVIALWSGSNGPKFKSLQVFGKISYPLYLVHVPLAWGVLAWLGGYGWNMNVAGITSVVIVVLISWGLHISVELPSHNFGRKVGSYLRLKSSTKIEKI